MKLLLREKQMTSYKITVWGAAGTGKTALIDNLVNHRFNADYVGTIGANLFEGRGSDATLQFWDVGGEKRYRSLVGSYCSGAQLFIYCIDLTQELKESAIREDIALMRAIAKGHVILVGTKSDLPEQKISQEALRALAERLGATAFFITSAKNNTGIDELFRGIDGLASAYAISIEDRDRMLQIPERMFIAPGVGLSTSDVLRKLPVSSPLYNALYNLFRQIQMLPQAKRNVILNAADALVDALQLPSTTSASATVVPNTTTDQKLAAIASFQAICAQAVKKPMQKIILDSIGVVVSAAFFTLLVGVIGFGIGFALGAWTGPGAFITAILGASSAAAIAVAATSGTVGVIAGVRNGCRLFKPSPLPALLNAVAQEAKAFEPSSVGPDVVV